VEAIGCKKPFRIHSAIAYSPLAATAVAQKSSSTARVMSMQASTTMFATIAGPQNANLGRLWSDVIPFRGDGLVSAHATVG